ARARARPASRRRPARSARRRGRGRTARARRSACIARSPRRRQPTGRASTAGGRMPERPGLSVIVIARNEAARIRRCLDAVRWAEELVVVDGDSDDATAEICRACGARVIVRTMRKGFGEQKAFALAQARQPWVLSIDADELVTPTLRDEIETALAAPAPHAGYRIPRLTSYLGRPIRPCGGYPRAGLGWVRGG